MPGFHAVQACNPASVAPGGGVSGDQRTFEGSKNRVPRELRFATLQLSALSCAVFLLLSLVLGFSFCPLWSFPGFLLSSLSLSYVLLLLWRLLPLNHRPEGKRVFSRLGPGTCVTVTRGVFISVLAGLLFADEKILGGKGSWSAWVPASIYLTAVFADILDGYLARSRHQTTRLGEALDMKIDALGLLIVPAVAISLGRLPLSYLLVGLAHYLFNLGIWVRKRAGMEVFEWTPTPSSRLLAGSQMAFVGVALLPVFSPEVMRTASWIFMLPFLAGFLKDWLNVSGYCAKIGSSSIGERELLKESAVLPEQEMAREHESHGPNSQSHGI